MGSNSKRNRSVRREVARENGPTPQALVRRTAADPAVTIARVPVSRQLAEGPGVRVIGKGRG